jgi:GNAT superfamily N-acetyltransferase
VQYDIAEKTKQLFESKYRGELAKKLHIYADAEKHFRLGGTWIAFHKNDQDAHGTLVAGQEITEMPGSDSVVIFYYVNVTPEFRGKGIGGLLHQMRLEIARDVGAKTALCTVNDGNVAEIAILLKAGWRKEFEVSPSASLWRKSL